MAADSPANTGLRWDRLLGRGCFLLLSATAVAAVTIAHVRFDLPTLVALSALAVVVVLALPGGPPSARWAVTAAAAVSLFTLARYPPLYHAEVGPFLAPGIAVGWLAVLAVAAMPWFRAASPRYAISVLVLLAIAYGLVVLGGPPIIDVWIILRDVANGLLAGQNPYEMSFPEVPADQTSACFNYLPATFLLTAPGQWLLGDVRWMTAAFLLLSVALLVVEALREKGEGAPARIAAALLVGVLPGFLTLVQQAWNEPILLFCFVAGSILIGRDKANLAIIPFAVALATKQHVVLFLPLLALWPSFGWRRTAGVVVLAGAICLPWLVANPQRFYGCTVAFYTSGAMTLRSQSLWQLLPDPARLPTLLVALVAACGIVLWRVPRTAPGLLVGCGTVLLLFSLFNKQSFFNQWVLAAELLTAGVALTSRNTGSPPPVALRLRSP